MDKKEFKKVRFPTSFEKRLTNLQTKEREHDFQFFCTIIKVPVGQCSMVHFESTGADQVKQNRFSPICLMDGFHNHFDVHGCLVLAGLLQKKIGMLLNNNCSNVQEVLSYANVDLIFPRTVYIGFGLCTQVSIKMGCSSLLNCNLHSCKCWQQSDFCNFRNTYRMSKQCLPASTHKKSGLSRILHELSQPKASESAYKQRWLPTQYLRFRGPFSWTQPQLLCGRWDSKYSSVLPSRDGRVKTLESITA